MFHVLFCLNSVYITCGSTKVGIKIKNGKNLLLKCLRKGGETHAVGLPGLTA